ncbi:MAG: histidinol dehydrogenase [Phycisphaerales bacterium]|nr:MAG: histidinol dehydrogenase [Phycisphaerales bacterium]
MSEALEQILTFSSEPGFEEKFKAFRKKMMLAARSSGCESEDNRAVAEILRAVAEGGDSKVIEYTERFDGVRFSPGKLRVGAKTLEAAHRELDAKLLASIRGAIDNVRDYQRRIFIGKECGVSEGTGIRYTPVRRVGVCVPGAAAPLPSTVIMTVVPAQVAGVQEIAVVSPPRHEGGIHPVILAVCRELGVEEVYRIGGAQAVAALAFGTDTIGKVDMIVGPGNKWVQSAKKHVAGDYVAIDSIAGPSDILIIANDQANPAWVAADMLSQAEHAADSSAIVVTDSKQMGREILEELKRQVVQLSRAGQATGSLISYSRIWVVDNMDKAIEIADDFGSEHLEIQCGDESRRIAERITNAGAIFIGPYTPVAVGDYWAGPSHTLPTGARARFSSALTSNDFLKSTSIIEYDRDRLDAGAADIIRLAEVEGLDAHARSVQIRQQH